jgi:hypothetical protein
MPKIKKFRSAAKCAKYVAPLFKRYKWTWWNVRPPYIPTQQEIRETLLELKHDLERYNNNETGRLRVERNRHTGRIYYIAPVEHFANDVDYEDLPVTK